MKQNKHQGTYQSRSRSNLISKVLKQRSPEMVQKNVVFPRLLYFTQPLCKECWQTESKVMKLQSEYGQHFELSYQLGGLPSLKDHFFRQKNSILKTIDKNRKLVSILLKNQKYRLFNFLDQPAFNTPLSPSVAFYAAELQSKEKAIHFFRIILEKYHFHHKDITRQEVLIEAADESGLNLETFLLDYHSREAYRQFRASTRLGVNYRIHQFPTLVLISKSGETTKVPGNLPYSDMFQLLENTTGTRLRRYSFSS